MTSEGEKNKKKKKRKFKATPKEGECGGMVRKEGRTH